MFGWSVRQWWWLVAVVIPAIPSPVLAVTCGPDSWPAWGRMWLLAVAIFFAVKWFTWADYVWGGGVPFSRKAPIRSGRGDRASQRESQRESQRDEHLADSGRWAPCFGRHLAYFFAWPGLNAALFLAGSADQPRRPTIGEWSRATVNFGVGCFLLWGLAGWLPPEWAFGRGWCGMFGIVLLLHFGLFHWLSCGWRAAGVSAEPLMDQPWRSTSLSEFWGRRWNTAFRDLTHRHLFGPLARRLPGLVALLLGFLVSGLVHDLVISWPAGGGYGGPTVFFLISGCGMVLERSRLGRRLGLRRGWPGWLFTVLLLVAPAPWLFHAAFIDEVVLPFMVALRAL